MSRTDPSSAQTLNHIQRQPLGESITRNLPSAMAPSRSTSTSSGKRTASSTLSRVPSSSTHHHQYDQGESSDGSHFGAAPRKPSKGRHSLNGGRLFSSSASRTSSRAEPMPSSDASLPSSVAHPPSSRQASSSYSNRSGMSALARANANARRVSMATGGQLANTGTLAPVKKLTVDSTSFDEWMKMATDNVSPATHQPCITT